MRDVLAARKARRLAHLRSLREHQSGVRRGRVHVTVVLLRPRERQRCDFASASSSSAATSSSRATRTTPAGAAWAKGSGGRAVRRNIDLENCHPRPRHAGRRSGAGRCGSAALRLQCHGGRHHAARSVRGNHPGKARQRRQSAAATQLESSIWRIHRRRRHRRALQGAGGVLPLRAQAQAADELVDASAKWLIWLLRNPELVELDVDRADLGTLYDDIGHIVELMPHEREALETLPPPDAQDPGRDGKGSRRRRRR